MVIVGMKIKVMVLEIYEEPEADAKLGCAFNHDPTKSQAQPSQVDRYVSIEARKKSCIAHSFGDYSLKKRLNVDSPTFTPASLSVTGTKSTGISPKAAHAAIFKPKGIIAGSSFRCVLTFTR